MRHHAWQHSNHTVGRHGHAYHASAGGYTEVLRWAREHGCPGGEDYSIARANEPP